jgi:hypothetical protein
LRFSRFLCALERSYNKCLYHNPMHASDVLHATAYLLHGKTAEAFSDEELLGNTHVHISCWAVLVQRCGVTLFAIYSLVSVRVVHLSRQ